MMLNRVSRAERPTHTQGSDATSSDGTNHGVRNSDGPSPPTTFDTVREKLYCGPAVFPAVRGLLCGSPLDGD